MKKYYLDTVAARSLTKDMQNAKDLCFTSALTMIELVTGLDNKKKKEGIHRRATLKAVTTSKIEIYWKDPLEIIVDCFAGFSHKESWMADLQTLVKEAISSIDFPDFLKRVDNLKTKFEDFKNFDKDLSTGFIGSVSGQIQKLRKEQKDSGEKVNYIVREVKLIAAIVDYISSRLAQGLTSEQKHNAVATYNGGIDIFLLAWKSYSEEKANQLADPGKNDWADLHHLMYLGNDKNITFVTNDKLLCYTLDKIGIKCISVEEMRKILNKQDKSLNS
jgi:hypothetical protein